MSSQPDRCSADLVQEGAGSNGCRHRNPALFVVGCPRSGTTLLQRMLDHHPQLAVANDTHFIPRCLEKLVPQAIGRAIAGADIPLTPELVEGVQSYHRFPRLGIGGAAVDRSAAGSRTYREFVSALYSEFGRRHGKPVAGEKTPDYVRHLPLLSALFPWARMIHIVRDGRDVALSLLEWAAADKGPGRIDLWREQPIAVCALWWAWLVNAGRRAGARLGPARYMEVGYEELVSRPEQTLRGIAAFLDLPFAPEMLRYHEGRVRSESGLSAKSAWLPPVSGLRDWKTQMTPRDVELFEILAGDLLSELGYRREARSISQEAAEIAESCYGWWESNFLTRVHSDHAPAC